MGIGSIKRSSSTKSSELLLKAVRMRPVRLPLKNLCNGTSLATVLQNLGDIGLQHSQHTKGQCVSNEVHRRTT